MTDRKEPAYTPRAEFQCDSPVRSTHYRGCKCHEARHASELETERMRLAAMSNTKETASQRIDRDSPYWSASYGDVCAAVDREMTLRDCLEVLAGGHWLESGEPLTNKDVRTIAAKALNAVLSGMQRSHSDSDK